MEKQSRNHKALGGNMNSILAAFKNINFKSTKLIITILLLGIGLSTISTVNYISKNIITTIEAEYKELGQDNQIRVTSFENRALNAEEKRYISELDGVKSIIIDYYMALMFANEEKNVIYQSKIQRFDPELDFKYSKLEEGKEGIILPDIEIKDTPFPSKMSDFLEKDVYFMIERISDTGEVSIEEFSVPVIGLYETKLNQHTSSIFVTPNLLERIQEFGQFDNTVFALDVLVHSQDDFTNVVDQIEKIGLNTVYAQKSLQSSIDNVKTFIRLTHVLSYIIIGLGIIVLMIFIIGKIKKREKEIAVMKVIGYSTGYTVFSVWIELIFYMVVSSLVAIVLIKLILELLMLRRLPFVIPTISFFSWDMLEIFFSNTSVLVMLSCIIALAIYVQIHRISPLSQLRDNQNNSNRKTN